MEVQFCSKKYPISHLDVVCLEDEVLVFPHDGHPGVDVDGDRDVTLQTEAGALHHSLQVGVPPRQQDRPLGALQYRC